MAAAAAKLATVTGAGGFVATQLVKILLEGGWRVRGTVRNTDAAKNAHLLALPGAGELLTLHKADLLDGPEVFTPILAGSDVVFHTASPFFTVAKAMELGEEFFVKPAVDGTLNVLKACQEAGIKSVVVTSSTAAVGGPRPAGHVYTEADWNDPESLRTRKIWYVLSKTVAEQAAWDYVKSLGAACTFRLATMNPCMVAGPMLQPSLNASSEVVLSYLNGSKTKVDAGGMMWVDVRDVARAHLLAHEKASEGRHILVSKWISYADLVPILASIRPDAPLPKEPAGDVPVPMAFDTSKAKGLGIDPFIGLEDMMKQTVDTLVAFGHLPPAATSKTA